MGRRHRLGIVQANRPVIKATRNTGGPIPDIVPGVGVDNLLRDDNSSNILMGDGTSVFLLS